MRYTYTESVGDSYITHEFEDLTLSEWLVVHKELTPNDGVPVTDGVHSIPVNPSFLFEDGEDINEPFVWIPKDFLPYTKEDLDRGGWFLKDTSLEAKKAFEDIGMRVYQEAWSGDGYASDLSDGMVFPNRIKDFLEEDSTTEIVLIDGNFIKKDIV